MLQPNAVPLVAWPVLGAQDEQAVLRVLRSGRLLNGPETLGLEEEWASFVGTAHCVAVSSCSHALHLALLALGVAPGDEVLVPALTFSGTVNPVVHSGATPVFVDILPGTYELDPEDAASKRTPRTKAAIPVHLHGMPCDTDRLASLLPGIPILEDACQAHGASLRGRRVGSLGLVACFSLNQVKPLPAGQGGLIVTNDDQLARRLRVLASHGAGSTIGWSYGITELAAAVARSQLKRLEEHNATGRSRVRQFVAALGSYTDLLPSIPMDRIPVWHKFRVRLPHGLPQTEALLELRRRHVEVDTWPGAIVPDLDSYRSRFPTVSCPIARQIAAESVVIGSELYPLAAQHPSTIDCWASALRDVLDRFHG